MCRFRFLIFLLLSFYAAQNLSAQKSFSYFFRHINQWDGLLNNQVLSITQDGRGFMWIATVGGLQRYDGSRFIYYPEMLSNPEEGIPANAEMHTDQKNNLLWITNNAAIEKMELDKNHFTVYAQEELLKEPDFIFNSYSQINNEKWTAGPNAAYRYDVSAKKNILYHVNIFPANEHRTSFIATDSITDNTWLATGNMLYLFDAKNGQVFSETFNPDHHPLLQAESYGAKGKFIRNVMMDSKKNIWVTTWGDMLYKYDDVTKKVSSYSLTAIKIKEQRNKITDANLLVNCMMEDDNHMIWVGTENAGLLRYNSEKDNFDYCIAQEKNSERIQYDYKIFNLFQDKDQNIWVGTDKGISIFNPYRQQFKSIRHEENNDLSIPKSEIISFIQTASGDMYIGTWGGGMAVYDSNFNFKKNILFGTVEGKGSNIDLRRIWCFTQVDDKTIWIGCQHGWLVVYNTETGASQISRPTELDSSTIRCMEKDADGNIWFGLHNGNIVKWDRNRNKFLPGGNNQQNNIKAGFVVLNIFIDRSQHCWVSTNEGFKEFDMEKRIYIDSWLPDKNNINSISGKYCQGIEEYNDSTLVIGTSYGGLNFFNKKTELFSQAKIADEVAFNTIYAIKKDTAGYIWFTTDYGLYKLNPADSKLTPYIVNQGFIHSSFISNKLYPLLDGRWLTFTLSEAISFFPDMESQDKNLKTEITGFKLFDKPVSIDSLLYKNSQVRLSYKENFFTIEFAALVFSGLQQTNYYYRLRGIDKDWINGGPNRFASYTDLQPGKYVFDVKAENGNNQGAITSFSIIIVPPFWRTWWFISILAFLLLVTIYQFIKWREKNIKTIEAGKLKVQQLNADQYKSKLEMEQIINYFSSTLIGKNTVDEVLWDVAKNLIGRLGFVDCMMYLWNDEKTKMIQKAGFGPKGSVEKIEIQPFDVVPGQGVVGYVMQTCEPVLIIDTSKDSRYRVDEMVRLSEITVPIIYENELIGVIDSEHHERSFFTQQHLQILSTIATLVANKIKSIETDQSLKRTNMEMYVMNEQLSRAKLEALRSQMNPHFIFNCINSIDALIQSNDKYRATVYLNKFAKLIRNILDSSKQNTVTLSKDVDTLKLYIELEQLRHENKFTATIQAEDALLQDDFRVPPLIIQPFVENSILHGIRYRKDNNGKLSISVIRQNDYLKYTIEDNGVGRGVFTNQIQKEEVSYGIDMSNERVKLFNKEEKASVQIIDLFDEGKPRGTKVEVLLKIQ